MEFCLHSKLYWTDAGANTGIYRSSLDNPVQETLVTGNLQQPDALTIDFTGIILSTQITDVQNYALFRTYV